MRVLWRVATLALALLAATVIGEHSAASVDTVILQVAADSTVNQTIVDEITLAASRMAAVWTMPPSAGHECHDKEQLTEKKATGLIHITDLDGTCMQAFGNPRRLHLIYNRGNKTLTTETGVVVTAGDPKFNEALDKVVHLVAVDARKHAVKETKQATSGVYVPIWSVIILGVLVGVLLAANCIFFNKLRAIQTKPNPADDKKAKDSARDSTRTSLKQRKAAERKKSERKKSASSSSKSSKKSSKDKRKREEDSSCRSSKSLSTKSCKNTAPTSVKVVSVGGPAAQQKKLEHTAHPLGAATDEVATVMALRGSSLPARTMDRRVEMPMTEDEFILSMKQVIQFVIDFYRNPKQYPVATTIKPNSIFTQLPLTAPNDPENFDDVWKTFKDVIMPGCVQWQHPQFHAFFPCGRSYPDILAETVISSLGTVGFTWSANPAITELDTAMVNWVGRALGIPETFLFRGNVMGTSEGGGWVADTASDAIFCAVMAARHTKVEQELAKLEVKEDKPITESTRHVSKKYEKRAEIISKLVAYGSYESHSSFEKACKMACVRCRPIKVFEQDDWGMRREHVEKEMQKDKQRGLIPFYLHVALGTTSTATSDHLHELTPLKELYNVWVHVDAAYAGSAWVVPEYRNNKGIEHVDSININLHKFFLTSTSVTLFWTRRQKDYKECFRVDPSYLKKKTGANDLRDWGIQLSRRFKSLKVYMLLRMYGINGMKAYVKRVCDMTIYMESLITKIPSIRKFGKTNYGLFCVQYKEEGMSTQQVNAATNRLCEYINNSHKMVLTHSNVRGHDILRVCITLERSTQKDIEESVAIFTQLTEEFRAKIHEDANFVKSLMSNISRENLLQDVDMGIVGSPNPTLSRTPANVKSTISGESLVGPRTAHSQLSALTSATQDTTVPPPVAAAAVAAAASPGPATNIEAIKTVQLPSVPLSAPSATPPPAPPTTAAAAAPAAANLMPPLTPAFDQAPPTFSVAEVTARSNTVTEKK
ncbi:hypothetical protein PRIPAC_92544 [Pristionchus pacificus]|nr:hypothetical protein PRIPAC_92544 [Pristionchus pacificus]